MSDIDWVKGLSLMDLTRAHCEFDWLIRQQEILTMQRENEKLREHLRQRRKLEGPRRHRPTNQ